ncbi:MAG: non-heme iron oxygenase ferredoxin subunit [Acidimicrobiia bacterium]|nr:MAG: non-heme iron oxygenase ferredoxin subunit [Acidimicrobiia bacterium]
MEVKVAALDELPDGRGVKVEIGDLEIAVFRTGDEVRAIGDRCSHARASLSEGEIFDGEVECPRHGSPFDLVTGEPQALPATTPVRAFPAQVRDGYVYLTVTEDSP